MLKTCYFSKQKVEEIRFTNTRSFYSFNQLILRTIMIKGLLGLKITIKE